MTINDKVELTNSYILVKRIVIEELKSDIIVLQDVAKIEKDQYEIVAKDPKVTEYNLGDMVVIDKFAGQEITIDGEKYSFTRPTEILLKYKPLPVTAVVTTGTVTMTQSDVPYTLTGAQTENLGKAVC